ncbi:MAG: FtsW/RodA/SpoVE family cell cycle protein [Bacteroidales bacterium]
MFKLKIQILGDKYIWMAVLFLYLTSLLTVYSSTGTLAYQQSEGYSEYYLVKQFLLLLVGFFAMYFVHLIKYKFFSRISQISLFAVVIPLLVLTLFVDYELNDAKRFLPLPFNLTFQPSDLAKVVLIVFLARLLSKRQSVIKSFKSSVIPMIIPVLIICVLIFPEDLSTAAMLFVCCFLMMFIGNISIKHLILIIGGVVLAMFLFVGAAYVLKGGKVARLETWKGRLERYVGVGEKVESQRTKDLSLQVEQAKIAIANGGIIGKGPGNSQQKNFLPHPYSDFIYAIIIEEYGFIGACFVLLLYLIIFSRSIKIVTKFPGDFGAFLAFGLSFLLVFQAMINMGVAVNVLPVTGQPLPLVSMGGTSTIITSITIGMIISVSKELSSDNKAEELSEVKKEVA